MGAVWNYNMTFFGLKSGQDLENQAPHPHQVQFLGLPPLPEYATGPRSAAVYNKRILMQYMPPPLSPVFETKLSW